MGKRVDQNQADIVKAIRALGAEWVYTSEDPRSGCDGIILWRGRAIVCELKNGALPPSRRKLTKNELETKAKCEKTGAPYLILHSPEDAMHVVAAIRR